MQEQDLSVLISGETLLHVEVGTSSIQGILGLMNEHIKSQNKRITQLEAQIGMMLSKQEYQKEKEKIISRIEQAEDRVAQTVTRFNGLANDVSTLEKKIDLTISERLNESLVSIQMQIRSATSSLEENIDLQAGRIDTLKRRVDVLEKQKPSDSLKNEIASLKDQIQNYSNLPSLVSKHETAIESLKKDINELRERCWDMEQEEVDRSETKSTARSDSHRTTALSNEAAPAYSARLESELAELEKDFDDHQGKVVVAMNAIRDELQLIRDHGQGLSTLPPLNLANVVPSFFNNPSFIFSKEDLGLDNDEEEIRTKGEIRMTRDTQEDIPEYSDEPTSAPRTRSKPPPAKREVVEEPEPVIVTVDEEGILRRLKNEINFHEMMDTFKKFGEDHKEVLAAVDRKIDREYVERLFDKFRVLIYGLNDRVKEMAAISEDYATREDIEVLAKILKKMPNDTRPATALKKGPGCLFCGKPRATVAGQISPRTAARAGKPAVGSIMGDGTCGEFVYGEGQAFKRDENFQSFPHLDVLPKLAKTSEV